MYSKIKPLISISKNNRVLNKNERKQIIKEELKKVSNKLILILKPEKVQKNIERKIRHQDTLKEEKLYESLFRNLFKIFSNLPWKHKNYQIIVDNFNKYLLKKIKQSPKNLQRIELVIRLANYSNIFKKYSNKIYIEYFLDNLDKYLETLEKNKNQKIWVFINEIWEILENDLKNLYIKNI